MPALEPISEVALAQAVLTFSPTRQDVLVVEQNIAENSLLGVPTEILLEIFKRMANLKAAIAFSQICLRCKLIWLTNTALICHAILYHTIACVDHAFEYIKVQPPVRANARLEHILDYLRAQSLDVADWMMIRDKDVAVVDITQQLCENAEIACRALRYFENRKNWKREGLSPGSSSQVQRMCFLRAWYRIHVLASLSDEPLPQQQFAALDMLEFEHMMEVVCWLIYCCPEEERLDLHVTYRMGGRSGLPQFPISAQNWHNLGASLTSFGQYLIRHLHDNRWQKDGGIHFWKLLLHEVYLNSSEKTRQLAEHEDLSNGNSL